MISKIKNMLLGLAAALALTVPVAVPSMVFADSISDGLCQGVNLSTSTQGCDASAQGQAASDRVNTLLTQVINIFSVIVGIIAVFMIIFGGLKYITSGGDSGNVSSAKNTIIYALVGLVIVALAQFIVKFVLGKATQTA